MNAPAIIETVPEKIPDWFPPTHKTYLRSIKQTEKHPLMKNFRDELDPNDVEKLYGKLAVQEYEKLFLSSLEMYLGDMMKSAVVAETYPKESLAVKAFLESSFDDRINVIRAGKIKIEKNEIKLGKLYEKLSRAYGEACIVPFDGLTGKKEWDNRFVNKQKSIDVVFTTKCEDILGMSSRSDWVSCQTISDNGSSREGYALRTLGSFQSKYVGIIYLTDKSDYRNRGEKMLYRSIVYLLRNKKDPNKYRFVISVVYPKGSPVMTPVAKVFEKYLEKNTGIESTFFSNKGHGEYQIHFDGKMVYDPYFDVGFNQAFDPDYILFRVKEQNQFGLISYLSPTHEEYPNLAEMLIKKSASNIQYIKYHYPKYDELAKRVCEINSEYVVYTSKQWAGRSEALYKIIKNNHAYLSYATRKEPWYKSVALKHVKENVSYLQYCDKKWKEYKPLAIKGIKEGRLNLTYADPKWKEYYNLAAYSIERNSASISYVSYKHPRYNYLCEMSARKWGNYNIVKDPQKRKEIIIDCFRNGKIGFGNISSSWVEYKDLVSERIKSNLENNKWNASEIQYVDQSWDCFDELINMFFDKIMQRNSNVFENMQVLCEYTKNYRSDKMQNFIKKACLSVPDCLRYLEPRYRKETVELILEKSIDDKYKMQQLIDRITKTDPLYKEWIIRIVSKHKGFSGKFDQSWEEYKSLMLEEIDSGVEVMKYIPISSPHYKEFAYRVYKKHHSLKNVSPSWKGYYDFLKEMIRKDSSLFNKYASVYSGEKLKGLRAIYTETINENIMEKK